MGDWIKFVTVAYDEGLISEVVRDRCIRLIKLVWERCKGVNHEKAHH